MDENQLSQINVDAAIESHCMLGGPGLLESVYRDAVALEIRGRDLSVESEKLVPIRYKGQ
jgi:GxxExxY protein